MWGLVASGWNRLPLTAEVAVHWARRLTNVEALDRGRQEVDTAADRGDAGVRVAEYADGSVIAGS